NIYIQSAMLNGQPYANTYLLHRDIVAGGTLQLTMGPQPNRDFGTAPANRPKERRSRTPPQNEFSLKKKILIHDIAKHLEVSIATVSLVLNGKAKEKRISDVLAEKVLNTNNDPAKTRDLLTMFQERHVDGYILALPNGVEAEVRTIMRSGKPLVLFDRLLPGVLANAVVVDGATG
nr:hypothetical protein [Tanacetum cinerariifolium]